MAADAVSSGYSADDLTKAMNEALSKSIEVQILGIKYQQEITDYNVKLAQVGSRAAKQVPQG